MFRGKKIHPIKNGPYNIKISKSNFFGDKNQTFWFFDIPEDRFSKIKVWKIDRKSKLKKSIENRKWKTRLKIETGKINRKSKFERPIEDQNWKIQSQIKIGKSNQNSRFQKSIENQTWKIRSKIEILKID